MTLPSPLFANAPLKSQPVIVTKQPATRNIQYVSYCKFCSEGFPNDSELSKHRRNHEKCPFDDCKFNASGPVVADHVQRVHMKTSALVKIQDLTTPEQIEKWREERRKRYPTSANVTLRQQAQEQRMERGEKLQERQQRFGDSQQKNHIKNFDKRNGDRSKHSKNQHQKRDQRHPNPKSHARNSDKSSSAVDLAKQPAPKVENTRKTPVTVPAGESSDEDAISTPKFKGTSQMKDYHKVETIVKEQAALSILGMYGSESEAEDDTAVEVTTQPAAETISDSVKSVMSDNAISKEETEEQDHFEVDNEAPEEQTISHEAPNDPQPSTSTERNPRKRKNESHQCARVNKMRPRTILDYSKLRSKPSVNPFLEKLLQEDIRHERNVLLQCVRYLVENHQSFHTSAAVVPSSKAESELPEAEPNRELPAVEIK